MESADKTILENIKKQLDLDKVIPVTRMTQKAGIRVLSCSIIFLMMKMMMILIIIMLPLLRIFMKEEMPVDIILIL